MWSQFRNFNSDFDFESGSPGGESLTKFVKFLRLEKNLASTYLWTYYSCLNSMMKQKYKIKLQDFPRLTMLIKGSDTDIKDKATIFDDTEIKSFMLGNTESAFWLERQAISILDFFRGPRPPPGEDGEEQ